MNRKKKFILYNVYQHRYWFRVIDREKRTGFDTTNEAFLTAYRREAYGRLQAFLRKSAFLEEIKCAKEEEFSGKRKDGT